MHAVKEYLTTNDYLAVPSLTNINTSTYMYVQYNMLEGSPAYRDHLSEAGP